MPYRSWAERREIIAAIVAEDSKKSVEDFQLTPSEEVFFRARTRKTISKLARKTSTFKAFYELKTAKPFLYILGLASIIVAFTGISAIYLYLRRSNGEHMYPLLGSCATIIVAAIGWCVAAWIAHRNAVRQNTTNIVFARFSQASFGDAMHRFHNAFGYDVDEKVSTELIRQVRSKDSDGAKAAEAVNYLLNYFEFLSAGVVKGDLDADVVRQNVRGVICYYYDKCEPHVWSCNIRNPKAFEHLMKIRTHYRDP